VRLHRLALAGILCGALLAAHAETSAPPLVSNERQGYAFEFPRVLAEQRLFGVAHGVSLLATACLDSPAEAEAASAAYTRWYEQQQAQIDLLKNELAEFYFGAHAAEASWAHVAEALKLRTSLGLAPDSKELQAACASFPNALRQHRYDLTALFQLEAALAAMKTATRAEAYTTACAARLPEPQRVGVNTHYAQWQAREAAALAGAQSQMQTYWQSTGTPGKAEDWLKATRKRYSAPTDIACAELSDWLDSTTSSLAQSFVPAPVIVAPAQPATDNTVSTVIDRRPTAAAPETAPPTPAPTVAAPAVEPTPAAAAPEAAAATPAPAAAEKKDGEEGPYLFDYVMRLFDERPHEDAASPAGKQPARSQRAHP
jgi:hypothetical protein